MPIVNIKTLSTNLTQSKARWTARQTPQSLLSDNEKKALLGNIIPPAVAAAAAAPAVRAAAAASLRPGGGLAQPQWQSRHIG